MKPQERSAHPGRSRLQGMIWGGLVLVILGVTGAGTWSLLGPRPGASARLPVYGRVPDFTLTERSGRRLGLSDLRGKVWVVNFMYTHCPDTCPFQSAALAQLQRELEGEKDVRLVSITVDPERDTPEVLARYAERFGAEPERWFFLTGEKRAIYRLAQEGFRLSVADPRGALKSPAQRESPRQGSRGRPPGKAGGPKIPEGTVTSANLWRFIEPPPAEAHHPGPAQPLLHSARFVLVDRQGRIRGYYGVVLQPGVQVETARPPVLTDDDALQKLLQDVKGLSREK